MLKLSENPPILFPEDANLKEIEGQWWVAHTKSRNEKALAWNLAKREIAYFLPLLQKTSRRKGRTYKTLHPLFSGYLFFCGDIEKRQLALMTNRIAQVIEVADQETLIQELVSIHQALSSGLPVDPHPHIKSGDRCRVIDGPLKGAEGFFDRKKNQTRILLQVDILGQCAAVEIDSELLEPIG